MLQQHELEFLQQGFESQSISPNYLAYELFLQLLEEVPSMTLGGIFEFLVVLEGALSLDTSLPREEMVRLGGITTYHLKTYKKEQ